MQTAIEVNETLSPFDVCSTDELMALGVIDDGIMSQLFEDWTAADQQAHDYANYVEQCAMEEAEALEMAA